MSAAAPRLYQEIEDIESQLDVCLHRIRDLEEHARVEIEQQKEEMHKLRNQLRRTLAAIAELHLPTTETTPPTASEAEEAASDAHTTSLPEMASDVVASPAPEEAAPFDYGAEAFDYGEEALFDDPFASVLPDTPIEIEDDPVSEVDEPIEQVNELSKGSDTLIEASIAETNRALEPTEYAEEPAGSADEAPEHVHPEPNTWNGPLDAEALSDFSDFIIPTDAFSSNLDDAFDAAPDPFAEAMPSAEKVEDDEAEEPKSLSEFDRLLDWSDFEPDEADNERAGNDALLAPSGDGMTATPVPPAPAVRRERPVAITRKTPAADVPRKEEQDLTVITGIDEKMQIALRRIGVTTLDEVASWHPADAQRIAGLLGTVSEREIFDVWVLEAQSALFDLFQQRLRNNRFHNLDEL